MQKYFRLAFLAAGLTFAAVAQADTPETMARNLERFERYAGPEVEEMRNFRLYRWRPLGELELAIWANAGDVYLVRLEGPCNGFDFAKTIHVTSSNRVVSRGIDAVEFQHQHCPIASIQPVDYKALQRESDD